MKSVKTFAIEHNQARPADDILNSIGDEAGNRDAHEKK